MGTGGKGSSTRAAAKGSNKPAEVIETIPTIEAAPPAAASTSSPETAPMPPPAIAGTVPPKPAGAAAAASTPTAEGELTRCPTCGSTRRTKYGNRREVEHGGRHAGKPHTHIVWRNTTCADCGQARVDMNRENRTAPASA